MRGNAANESPTESIVTWPESLAEAWGTPLFHPGHSRAPIGSACRTVASIPARDFRHMLCCFPWFGFFFRNCNWQFHVQAHSATAPTVSSHADILGPSPGICLSPIQRVGPATLTRHVPAACHVQMQKCNGNHRTWKCRREPDCFSICYATSSRIGLSQPNLTRISCLPAWRLSRSILCNAIYCANFHGH